MKYFIISAMKEEIDPLIKAKKCVIIDECIEQKIYYYKTNNKEFFIFNSGIGKVNAAITTTAMILKYDPDFVYSIGTAGGYSKNLKVCDVVIADKIAFHDVDVSAFGYQYGQLPGKNKYFEITGTSHIKEILSNSHVGTILTGDRFVSDDSEEIFKNFENVYALEMESCSIVMTCENFDVKCYVVRTISDLVNKESTTSFDNYLKKASMIFIELVDGLER